MSESGAAAQSAESPARRYCQWGMYVLSVAGFIVMAFTTHENYLPLIIGGLLVVIGIACFMVATYPGDYPSERGRL